MTFSIVVYFLLFSSVLGFLFLHIKGYLTTKLIMIAAMFYMSSAIVFSFNSYMGWPARDMDAPDGMVLTNVLIFDKTNKSDGYIYVTGIPCGASASIEECMIPHQISVQNPLNLFGYIPSNLNTPRIFLFPYTDSNRKMFFEAKENIEQGGTSRLRHGKKGKGQGKSNGTGQEGDSEGQGTGQDGEGTPNAESDGANEIYIDNQAFRDVLKKDSVQ